MHYLIGMWGLNTNQGLQRLAGAYDVSTDSENFVLSPIWAARKSQLSHTCLCGWQYCLLKRQRQRGKHIAFKLQNLVENNHFDYAWKLSTNLRLQSARARHKWVFETDPSLLNIKTPPLNKVPNHPGWISLTRTIKLKNLHKRRALRPTFNIYKIDPYKLPVNINSVTNLRTMKTFFFI